MKTNPILRLAISLALSSPAAYAATPAETPPDYQGTSYTTQIWMEETLSNVVSSSLVENQAGVNQSEASSGLVDIKQNGAGNIAGTNESKLIQSGLGNTLRIGQGASFDASAITWGERWSAETPVIGNTVYATQLGNNSTASVYQLSNNNTATIIQSSETGSTATLTQSGAVASTTTIDQAVDATSGTLTGHTSTIYQTGGTLSVTQRGSGQTLNLGSKTVDGIQGVQFAPSTSSNGGFAIDQAGANNTISMTSSGTTTAGVYGAINQTGTGNSATITTTDLSTESGAYIKQTGTGNTSTASFKDAGGLVDIQQAEGTGGTGSNQTIAAVSGGAQIQVNQEGSGNVINAEMSGGTLNVGTTDRTASNGTGVAGQAGENNRLVVRGNGAEITATQTGNLNKMHLGGTPTYSQGAITGVTTNGDGLAGGTLNVAQSGDSNLINVAASTTGANLNITQTGNGARVDVGTVSSRVDILQ